MTKRSSWFSRSFVFVFALSALAWIAPPAVEAAEIIENSWISDNYSVKVTWDDTWFVVDEEPGVYDSVTLTNGLSYVTFVAGPDSATTSEAVLAGFLAAIRDPSVSNFEPLRDSNGDVIRGEIGDRSFAAFSFTQTYEDDSTGELEVYLEGSLIVSGQTSLGLIAYLPAGYLESELPAIRALADSVVKPGPDPDPVPGERAPVFVSGSWRVAVVTSILNSEIPGANLKEKSGKEWLVVIADVTNWTDRASELSLREFELDGEGLSHPFKAAPNSAKTVAIELGLQVPVGDELVAVFKLGETLRVALVFQIPDGSRSHELVLGDVGLPLADTLQSTLEPGLLPEVIAPPELIVGEIVSASGGRTVRIQFDGETEPQRIRLLGVDLPAEGSCHEQDAEKLLDSLAGTTVLVESDAALTEAKTLARYVWVTIFDGSRTLLNQRLIAEGVAESGTLPRDARFGLWLETTESDAQREQIGLWGACETPKVSRNSGDPKSSPISPTPRPTSTPEA